jgi:3-hydroxybutyryl-CoA dehydrogenase
MVIMQIKRVGFVGFGKTAVQIAEAAALAGYRLSVWDRSDEALRQGKDELGKLIDGRVSSGGLTGEDKQRLSNSVTFGVDLASTKDSDLVIEFVSEDLVLKKGILSELSSLVGKQSLIATGTACFSVTELSKSVKNPERFLGLHFLEAPQGIKLAEVVKGERTSQETISLAQEFCGKIGKETVTSKDSPGFIANYLFVPYMNQALEAYDHGLASKEDLDTAIRMGLGYPSGPLELIDRTGLERHLELASILYERLGDARFAPPAVLKRMIDGGRPDGEAGPGFYGSNK